MTGVRHPSTISREPRRNAATRGGRLEYRASVAQWKADLVAQRPKAAKPAANDRLRNYVQERLSGQVSRLDGTALGPQAAPWKGRNKPHRGDRRWATAWSPEQIANRLKVDFPDDESLRISHEAIYQALFIEGRGALQREVVACLRIGRALRVPRARARRKAWAHVTPEVLISARPAEADDRAVPGHWEGDLLIGLERSAIGTLVERTTRFTIETGVPVYSADPHSPWQRGTDENTNGLLRQYFPKGTDLSRWAADDIEAAAATLNSRPRKSLGWKTPAEALDEHLLSLQEAGVTSTD